MSKHDIINAGDCFRGYKVPSNLKCDTYYAKTLEQADDLIESWTQCKRKVVVRRLDIRNPQDGSKILSGKDQKRFFERVKRNIFNSEKQKGRDGAIGWLHVTEQTSENGNPHIHAVIFADGNSFRNGHAIYEEFKRQSIDYFGEKHSALIHEGPCVVINNNSSDFLKQKEKAFEMCLYLAKTETKEFRGKNSRVSTRTRLPKSSK